MGLDAVVFGPPPAVLRCTVCGHPVAPDAMGDYQHRGQEGIFLSLGHRPIPGPAQ